MTPIYISGFEQGILPPAASGSSLMYLVGGTAEISSSVKKSGDYSLRVYYGATYSQVGKDFGTPASKTLGGRCDFRIASFGSGEDCLIFVGSGANGFTIYLNHTSHVMGLQAGSGTIRWDTTVLLVDTWYSLDFKCVYAGTTSTIDAKLNGTALTQATTGAMTENGWFRFFADSSGSDNYLDNVVLSFTAGDYPIASCSVVGLRPSADGTHSLGGNITDEDSGTTNLYAKLDENPWITTANDDLVMQVNDGTGNYAEILFADTTETTILGAMAILQYAAATATACTGGCTIIDEDALATTLWGASGALADYSEITAFYKSVILPAPAGGWDMAAVNALKSRIGYSGDANPDPYWLALMLEVAYVPSTGTTWIPKVIVI